MKKLGKHLKKQRLAKGLSQWDVASKLGLTSAQFISNIERGKAPIPFKYLKQLDNILDIDLKKCCNLLVKDFKENLYKEVGL